MVVVIIHSYWFDFGCLALEWSCRLHASYVAAPSVPSGQAGSVVRSAIGLAAFRPLKIGVRYFAARRAGGGVLSGRFAGLCGRTGSRRARIMRASQ